MPERAPPLAAAQETKTTADAKPPEGVEAARPRGALAYAPQAAPAAADPDAQGKVSPLLDDSAISPPLPPTPARSIRRASADRPAVDRSGGRKCELFVPRGYRVGWRIRGGKPTSCYVERIR